MVQPKSILGLLTWNPSLTSWLQAICQTLNYSKIFVGSRLIDLCEQHVPLFTNEKSKFLWNNTYPTCATMCLCFRRINYYFINMNKILWIKSVDLCLFEHFELHQVHPCSHCLLLEKTLSLRRLYALKQTIFVPKCCRTDIQNFLRISYKQTPVRFSLHLV